MAKPEASFDGEFVVIRIHAPKCVQEASLYASALGLSPCEVYDRWEGFMEGEMLERLSRDEPGLIASSVELANVCIHSAFSDESRAAVERGGECWPGYWDYDREVVSECGLEVAANSLRADWGEFVGDVLGITREVMTAAIDAALAGNFQQSREILRSALDDLDGREFWWDLLAWVAINRDHEYPPEQSLKS